MTLLGKTTRKPWPENQSLIEVWWCFQIMLRSTMQSKSKNLILGHCFVFVLFEYLSNKYDWLACKVFTLFCPWKACGTVGSNCAMPGMRHDDDKSEIFLYVLDMPLVYWRYHNIYVDCSRAQWLYPRHISISVLCQQRLHTGGIKITRLLLLQTRNRYQLRLFLVSDREIHFRPVCIAWRRPCLWCCSIKQSRHFH